MRPIGTPRIIDWLNERQIRPDMILIGEPTSVDRLGDTVKIGRRGSVNMWIDVPGVQGHVAYPHRATNPVPPLARIIAALDAVHLDDGTEQFPPSNLEFTGDLETPTARQQRHSGLGDRPAQHPLQQSAARRGPRSAWSRRSPSAKRRERRSRARISGRGVPDAARAAVRCGRRSDRGGDGHQARAVDQRRHVRRPLPDPAMPGGRFRPAQRDHAQGRRVRRGGGHSRAVADLRARSCGKVARPRRPTWRCCRAAFRIQARNSSSNIGCGENIALDGVAAHRAQDVGLGDGLDRLGDDLAADALDQLDHGLDDHPRLLADSRCPRSATGRA